MADGSQVTARIRYDAVPRLPGVEYYLDQGCVPGGTLRNYDSYASKVGRVQELHKRVLCDTQTSGGLLIRSEEHTTELQSLMRTSYAVFCLKKKNKHN